MPANHIGAGWVVGIPSLLQGGFAAERLFEVVTNLPAIPLETPQPPRRAAFPSIDRALQATHSGGLPAC